LREWGGFHMNYRTVMVLLIALALPGSSTVEVARKARLAQIEQRLKAATPCPWKSDGRVDGWWNGEQPGVMIRATVNLECQEWDQSHKLCMAGTEGGPVAEVSSAKWTGSHNPIGDAEFIAHACEDIDYLLRVAKAE
jgi:hypothetical protein